jgi:hypothetical protein
MRSGEHGQVQLGQLDLRIKADGKELDDPLACAL